MMLGFKGLKKINPCNPCENSLDIFLFMFQEHFVCKQRHLIVILAKF